MAALGYEGWGEYGILGRRFFVKGDEKRTPHVHTFQSGNPDIDRHIYLRDYLKMHPEAAQEYGKLKSKLAQQFKNDRRGYFSAKENFVKALEKKAIKWVREKKT